MAEIDPVRRLGAQVSIGRTACPKCGRIVAVIQGGRLRLHLDARRDRCFAWEAPLAPVADC